MKVVVYGRAGTGKTTLASTTGDPSGTLVLSVESGLLSLRNFDLSYREIATIDELIEVGKFLKTGKHDFRWCILDSVSEIAETCLANKKATVKSKAGKPDVLRAYGEMNDTMTAVLKAFRDLPMHVVMTAQQDRVTDEDGKMYFGPSLPGKRLAQGLPYIMDEVFALRLTKDEDGGVHRWLQCHPDAQFDAKDRSGALEQFEKPSLEHVLLKIKGDNNA